MTSPFDLLQLTKTEEREFQGMERAMRDASSWLDDPSMLRLAHPVRMMATPATSPRITYITMAEPRNQPLLKQLLTQQLSTVDTFHALERQNDRRLLQFYALHVGTAEASGGYGNGAAGPTAHSLRFLTGGGRIFTFDDDLVEQLHQTRLGTDIPVSELQLPTPNIYIELGRNREASPFTLFNGESGEHLLEGAYVSEVVNAAGERGIEVTMTGSPLGRLELMDDAVEWLQLKGADSRSITDALIEAYTRPSSPDVTDPYFDDQARLQAQAQAAIPKVELIIKCLLFLGMSEAMKLEVRDGTEARKALMRAQSGAHKRRAARAVAKSYDRVVVSAPPVDEGIEVGDGGEQRRVSTHWREPHMRMQRHGPGLSLTKVIWIRRALVNPPGKAST